MRQTSSVLYISVDGLVDSHGAFLPGFEEFVGELDRAGIPSVWLSWRTRMQLDEPRRKLGHTHPFIIEDGCGVLLPQDYFHLRPRTTQGSKAGRGAGTVRLGRFVCLPIAEEQPAAAEALEALADESGLDVVPVRSLAPRELAQNLGLPQREADMARQRDFDELFFLAGGTGEDVCRFRESAQARGCQLRQRSALWSLAIGASVPRSVRELSRLYDRALHAHARSIALGVRSRDEQLLSACDRAVVLTEAADNSGGERKRPGRVMELPIRATDRWAHVFDAVVNSV